MAHIDNSRYTHTAGLIMSQKLLSLLPLFGLVMVLAAPAASAPAPPQVRIRGTIERVDGSTYVVRNREGAEVNVALAAKPQIADVVKASLSDIHGSELRLTTV